MEYITNDINSDILGFFKQIKNLDKYKLIRSNGKFINLLMVIRTKLETEYLYTYRFIDSYGFIIDENSFSTPEYLDITFFNSQIRNDYSFKFVLTENPIINNDFFGHISFIDEMHFLSKGKILGKDNNIINVYGIKFFESNIKNTKYNSYGIVFIDKNNNYILPEVLEPIYFKGKEKTELKSYDIIQGIFGKSFFYKEGKLFNNNILGKLKKIDHNKINTDASIYLEELFQVNGISFIINNNIIKIV